MGSTTSRCALAIGVVVLAGFLGLTVTSGPLIRSELGEVPTVGHPFQGRRFSVEATEGGSAAGSAAVFVPFLSLLRRKTDTPPNEPFYRVQISNHRRDELGIIVDLLTIAENPASKKAIRHGVGLNLDQTNRYLSFLIDRQLLSVTGATGRRFVSTERGRELLLLLRHA